MTITTTRPTTRRTLTGRTARVLRGILTAARYAPAAPVVEAERPVPDPAGLFAPDEIPPLAEIEAAAEEFFRASEQARAADRARRAARKLLDRLPAAGRYGAWDVERAPSGRQTPDLVAIRETYQRLGLGDLPMRDSAPALRVTLASDVAESGARQFANV